MAVDLVLSSGFLAFARHLGFLEGVAASRRSVDAIVGTSSGALVGALFASGLSIDDIAREIGGRAPIRSVGLHAAPWRGFFSMRPLIARLRGLLPPTIEALERPLAVGVADRAGNYRLLTQGPLPEAVAASCAMPHIFHPVRVQGEVFHDGGAVDRLGLGAWRRWRADRSAIVHHVERTAGVEVDSDATGLITVRTPRSGASFLSLGDFAAQRIEAQRLTEAALRSEDAL